MNIDIHTCHADCQRPACVAVREREKVAKWMIERSYATGHGDTIEDLLAELDWQIKEQREWQGLTDSERNKIFDCYGYGPIDVVAMCRAIEAKLKGKNA